MTRITNEQREAIVLRAIAERDALLATPAPAAQAPSDAVIDSIARDLFGEPVGNWFGTVGRPFARAVLAFASSATVQFKNVDGKCNCALYPAGTFPDCPHHPEPSSAAQASKDYSRGWMEGIAAAERDRAALASKAPEPLTDEQIKEAISFETGFTWEPGELQPMNADELLRIARSIESLAASPPEAPIGGAE